jgi:hypothetical protein
MLQRVMIILASICLWYGAPDSVQAENEGPNASSMVPVAVVSQSQFQFDPVLDGTVVEHEFVMENTGTGPLIIEHVKTGCGCTTADYDMVIPPGGSGKISVKANTRGYGGSRFLRDILVSTNDPANKQVALQISGQVDHFAEINPKSVFLQGKAGEAIQAKVTISPNLKYPFHITGSSPSQEIADKVKVDVESGQNNYGLIITNLLVAPGSYYGNIQLETDNAAQSELIINVRGKIQ